jgi:hypothetical protein
VALDIGTLVGSIGLDDSGVGEGLSGVFDKLKDAGGKMAKIGAAAGAGVATVLGASLAGAMDAEPATDKLAAQLGATGQFAKDLGKVAGDLYAQNFGDSMADVSEAVKTVFQNGLLT